MSAFEKVIGYDAIKEELEQICDMMQRREEYTVLGAKIPHGVLLYGAPGLGKTLTAQCFIEQSGRRVFTVRKDKSNRDFVGSITQSFADAQKNAPSIVFLDDLDKFANVDAGHKNADEFIAVQSGIDAVRKYDVFVIATANDISGLPQSLTRSGRFDRKILFQAPNNEDARKIIAHYLSAKKVSPDLNWDDLSKMICYSSCAELETFLNEAAIYAAHARKKEIEMCDLVKAVLKMQYRTPEEQSEKTPENVRELALHEAGHIVVDEVLQPGSVGFASIRTTGRDHIGGFVHRCAEPLSNEHAVLGCLAGKAAVELFLGDCANGCVSDIDSAFTKIRRYMAVDGGLGMGMIDVTPHRMNISESYNAASEAVVRAEMERCMFRAKSILLQNREFLERTAEALSEKQTLLASDIREIRESVEIRKAAV